MRLNMNIEVFIVVDLKAPILRRSEVPNRDASQTPRTGRFD